MDRDKTYSLRPSEIHLLTEVGKFRVVSVEDLAKFNYAGDRSRMESDLRNLKEQGLIVQRGTSALKRESRQVLTLTKQGQHLIRRHGFVAEDQAIYSGFAKPKEADHDADLYRMYRKAAQEIDRTGGKVLQVQLDYELKEKLYQRLAAFETHLLAYSSLFSALPELRFIYIATRPTHFESAQKLFLSMLRRAPNTDSGVEVLRYFTLRQLWEAKQYSKLNNEDMEFLNHATKRFDDAPTDILYRQWTVGRISSEAVRAEFCDLRPKQEVSFSTELVDGQAALFEANVRSPHSLRVATQVKRGSQTIFGPGFKPAFATKDRQGEEK